MPKLRVRIAPSPTGYMHIGNFRTALYNYLFAKKNGADFILRIEDTDQKRFVEGALENLLKTLKWAGLEWNEGPKLKKSELSSEGEYGPYIQSEKLETYKKYADKLVKDGQAYYCFCAPERLGEMRKEQQTLKKPPIYDKHCLNLSKEEIKKNLKENKPYVIRLKVPENEIIEFDDLVRGKIKFNTDLIDDQILLKSDGYPTYHLANVVDDHEMKITHVIRGEEWLSSVPKHLLLYRYFGWEKPKFAHLPLLLNPDRSKLSKRQGDVAVEDYIQKGYLKEALINFVALLGWNPGEGETQEIFSLEELIEKFDLSHVHKGGAIFDVKKMDWINAQWIKKLSLDKLCDYSKNFWEQKDFFQNAQSEKKSRDYIKKVLTIEQERLTKLNEVGESNKFFFRDINYDRELLRWKEMSDGAVADSLQKSLEIVKEILENNWTKENLEKIFIETAGDKKGELLWPLRVALTGEQKSPPPSEVAWVLGKEESLKRIEKAIKLLNLK